LSVLILAKPPAKQDREDIVNQQLTAMCQTFLFPAAVLVTAIGVAHTEGIKIAISFIGIVLSGTWIYRVCEWPDLSTSDWRTAMILAGLFGVMSVISFVVHIIEWRRPSGVR
jgi:hypothetical protein